MNLSLSNSLKHFNRQGCQKPVEARSLRAWTHQANGQDVIKHLLSTSFGSASWLLALVSPSLAAFLQTEYVESVVDPASERNHFDWQLSKSGRKKRNWKRKGTLLDPVTVGTMISAVECSFPFLSFCLFFLLSQLKDQRLTTPVLFETFYETFAQF